MILPQRETTMALEQILGLLDGVQKRGRGYLARCPAHDDRHPSLSIGEGDDGRVLLRCWAGCETKAVLEALGLSWSDLFPTGSRARGRQ